MGDDFLRLPEFRRVTAMLEQARRGLKFSERTSSAARRLIAQLFASSGPRRLLLLLELLDTLSRDRRATPIASAGYRADISSREGDTVDSALRYLNENFAEPVTLRELCRHLHVSSATCNRLLNKSIGRSFKTALIEVRIAHAARLLAETTQPIVDIAYASGFGNLSNFNRHFKQLKGRTPRDFRRALEQ
jgi:AraC-like DNA-binding protein